MSKFKENDKVKINWNIFYKNCKIHDCDKNVIKDIRQMNKVQKSIHEITCVKENINKITYDLNHNGYWFEENELNIIKV